MIHAYDRNYLGRAQTLMGVMFHVAVYDLGNSLERFYDRFLFSRISSYFEAGDSSILGGMSGVELALEILDDDTRDDCLPVFDRSSEYWCGWALAYFQWQTNLNFRDINALIPISEVLALYSPYHEMDITQFCDKMLELYNTRKGGTNLKMLRLNAGLSQRELAEISDVPVRTIQQYEQNKKNINAAKAETVVKLAKALNTSVEKLMEIDVVEKCKIAKR